MMRLFINTLILSSIFSLGGCTELLIVGAASDVVVQARQPQELYVDEVSFNSSSLEGTVLFVGFQQIILYAEREGIKSRFDSNKYSALMSRTLLSEAIHTSISGEIQTKVSYCDDYSGAEGGPAQMLRDFSNTPHRETRYFASNHNQVIIYEKSSGRFMNEAARRYLIRYFPHDFYLSISGGVDGLAVPENARPSDVQVLLLVKLYDRTGRKVFARTYEKKYVNTLDVSVPAVDVYEYYMKQLINESSEAMNKDLAFLKTAATPTGPTLKDYMEGKSK